MSDAPLRRTEAGHAPDGEGWFVLNARDASWQENGALSTFCHFEDDAQFEQVGINVSVLEPGRPMCMYHREVEQEDFLVVSGEPLLVIEGEERRLRPWDFVHCPPRTRHVIVGAGDRPAVIVCVGSRFVSTRENWGAYVPDETAARHDACVERETTSPQEAYARFPEYRTTRYREDWLPAS